MDHWPAPRSLATTSGISVDVFSSRYSGATTVAGGTLTVSGSIADSQVLVAEGGVLAGTGTVGGTTVAAGGTLDTASNGVGGTLHVQGGLTLQSGSSYLALVDTAGGASATDVTGAVSLDGGALQADVSGHPTLVSGTSYTLLDAAGGITGTFGSVAGNLATDYYFLSPVLTYGADSVTLTIARNANSFASAGGTRNERAAGTGLDTAIASALTSAFENLDRDSAQRALGAVSGEIHASARTELIQNGFYLRNAVVDRLQGPGCNPAADDGAVVCGPRGVSLWGTAYGAWGHNGGNGNASGVHGSLGGFVLGADTAISDTTRVGALIGYGHAAFDSGALASNAHSNDVTLGVYAAQQWQRLSVNYGALYSWNMLSTNRSAAVPGYADHLTSDYLGGTAQAFADLSYLAYRGEAVQLSPFAELAYVNLHTDGFHEHGGDAALRGRAMDTGNAYSTFGLRGRVGWHLGRMALTTQGSLGWQHVYGNVTPTAHESLGGGGDFEVAGVDLARNAAVLDAGLGARLAQDVTVQLAYVGQYGSKVTDNGVRGKVALRF